MYAKGLRLLIVSLSLFSIALFKTYGKNDSIEKIYTIVLAIIDKRT